MTKKDYILIAQAIRESEITDAKYNKKTIAENLAKVFLRDNPSFKPNQFVELATMPRTAEIKI